MFTRLNPPQLLHLSTSFNFAIGTLKSKISAFATKHKLTWRAYRHILRALPSTLGGIVWFSIMLYVLIAYETLPHLSNGDLPRIGLVYAVFPYISSVGALHTSTFQACAILVAILMSTGLLFWSISQARLMISKSDISCSTDRFSVSDCVNLRRCQ